MSQFYYYINEAETRQNTEGHKDGAILFAVSTIDNINHNDLFSYSFIICTILGVPWKSE